MKSYNFNICKYSITITIERKKYEVVDRKKEKTSYPVFMPPPISNHYVSTLNEPTEEIKMEEPEHLCLMEAAERHIDSKREELKTSTIKGYENIVYHHLDEVWLIYLTKLTEEHLQSAFDEEMAKGLNVKTLKGYRSFVLKVLAEYRPDFHPNIHVTKEGDNETA